MTNPEHAAEPFVWATDEDDQQTFHFNVGNSTNGPIGFCAAVTARSREEAVQLLKDGLPWEMPLMGDNEAEGIEYARVYLNPDSIMVEDIDFVE